MSLAHALSASSATPMAPAAGTRISVRCTVGRSKSLPISRTTSQPTMARNASGTTMRRRERQGCEAVAVLSARGLVMAARF
jgi:hypothetical protein